MVYERDSESLRERERARKRHRERIKTETQADGFTLLIIYCFIKPNFYMLIVFMSFIRRKYQFFVRHFRTSRDLIICLLNE